MGRCQQKQMGDWDTSFVQLSDRWAGLPDCIGSFRVPQWLWTPPGAPRRTGKGGGRSKQQTCRFYPLTSPIPFMFICEGILRLTRESNLLVSRRCIGTGLPAELVYRCAGLPPWDLDRKCDCSRWPFSWSWATPVKQKVISQGRRIWRQ